MCNLKNGVGVVLANGEKLVVVNGMLVNKDTCININLYNDYHNKINHNLNIVKIYKHLSDRWSDGYLFGLLDGIENSELLFDYSRYKIKIIDNSSIYAIRDNEFVYDSLEEAEKEYYKIVERAIDTLTKERWIDNKTPIFKSEQFGFKATMFGTNEKDIERDDVIFPIKIIMKKY